ncbi:fatty acid desaturase-domain-containing protein [Gorgonomyces haynaldii]|nr:fatty acid desaturase-domain-containing protein [Gorgonomyces haynaldii]
MPTFLTIETIEERVQKGETLIIILDKVYNLTKWGKHHPGGELVLKHLNGKDASDATLAFHPDWVWEKKMPYFCIGELHPKDRQVPKVSQDYRALNEELKKQGLFKTDYFYFARELIKFVFLWVGAFYLCVYRPEYWFWSATMLGTLWHQAAFFAHDAAHSGITHVSHIDQTFGIGLISLFGGLSLGWWKRNHNVHHIVTNEPENDPDIQHLPFFAVSPRFVENLYSSYYKTTLEFDGVAKYFVPLQHYTFYILLAFGRFNLYVNSWAYIFAKDYVVEHRKMQIVFMAGFWVWMSYMLSFLPSAGTIFLYVLWSHVLTTFLHVQITLSHFGMDTNVVDDETFAEKALRTTMDVDCPRYMDWFHGGLQFQIEHHLYPRLPRHNLRRAQPLVKDFAKKNNLPFHHYEFIKGNRYVLGVLEDVANQISVLVAPKTSHIKSE